MTMVTHELVFDTRAHPVDAIQRALYRFSDRVSSDLIIDGERCRCSIHVGDADEAGAEQLLADLRNEVLDQTLRQRVREETREVRNLVLALAFSNTGLVDDATAA